MSNHKNTVKDYFEDVYRTDRLTKASRHKLVRYRHAITQLHVFTRTKTYLWNVSLDTLDAFQNWLGDQGYGRDSRRTYRLCIQRILNHARPELFPPASPPEEEGAVGCIDPNPFILPEINVDPQLTLARFLMEVYATLKRSICTKTINLYRGTVNSIGRHYNRQVIMGELTDDFVLPWLAHLYNQVSAATLKRHRGDILAL